MTRPPPDLILPPFAASAAPRAPSRRGGVRPGAGAPKGNLNGLKHGHRSRLRPFLDLQPTTYLATHLLAKKRCLCPCWHRVTRKCRPRMIRARSKNAATTSGSPATEAAFRR